LKKILASVYKKSSILVALSPVWLWQWVKLAGRLLVRLCKVAHKTRVCFIFSHKISGHDWREVLVWLTDCGGLVLGRRWEEGGKEGGKSVVYSHW